MRVGYVKPRSAATCLPLCILRIKEVYFVMRYSECYFLWEASKTSICKVLLTFTCSLLEDHTLHFLYQFLQHALGKRQGGIGPESHIILINFPLLYICHHQLHFSLPVQRVWCVWLNIGIQSHRIYCINKLLPSVWAAFSTVSAA